jgi:Protein of unknown function (DUF2829)
MDIGQAIRRLQSGDKVAREGWNGKGMYLFLVRDWDTRDGLDQPTLPFVAMKTVNGGVVPWLCSQTDLLANDWEVADV